MAVTLYKMKTKENSIILQTKIEVDIDIKKNI